MNLKTVRNKTADMLFFDKNSLKLLEEDADNLNANLKYWLTNSDLVALKKGVYLFQNKYGQSAEKDAYMECIAMRLLSPSYLSLEYVLGKYQLLSEPVFAVTSVSVKSDREFSNTLGIWRYYAVPLKLFTGYKLKYFKNQPIAEAAKAKALFDFLYLRFRRGPAPELQSLENLRINWENLNKQDWRELNSYFKLLSGKRWKVLYSLIKQYAD